MSTTKIGQLFVSGYTQPLAGAGAAQKIYPGALLSFYAGNSGYGLAQNVYQDAALTTPYSQPIAADAAGRFPPIYLHPSLFYAVKLSSLSGLIFQADGINPLNMLTLLVSSNSVHNTQSVSSNTSLVVDPYMQVAIPAAGFYRFELDANFTTSGGAGSTPGLKYQITFAGGLLNVNAANAYVASLSTGMYGCVAINSTFSGLSLTGGGATDVLHATGSFQASGPGTLELQYAQNNSSVAAVVRGTSSLISVLRML